MNRSLAIIPARGGSKRIPRKNIRDFCGKPILGYSLETALSCREFDEVMVSTDSEEIARIARQFGARVPFSRSEATSNDFATLSDVIFEVLETYRNGGKEFRYCCCILPTAPFISGEDLTVAFRMLVEKNFHSVIPIVRFGYPIQRALSVDPTGNVSMIWPENLSARSQDLQPAYHDAGQFYWFSVEQFLIQKRLFMEHSGGIILSDEWVQDIDTEEDWRIAEKKFGLLNGKRK